MFFHFQNYYGLTSFIWLLRKKKGWELFTLIAILCKNFKCKMVNENLKLLLHSCLFSSSLFLSLTFTCIHGCRFYSVEHSVALHKPYNLMYAWTSIVMCAHIHKHTYICTDTRKNVPAYTHTYIFSVIYDHKPTIQYVWLA